MLTCFLKDNWSALCQVLRVLAYLLGYVEHLKRAVFLRSHYLRGLPDLWLIDVADLIYARFNPEDGPVSKPGDALLGDFHSVLRNELDTENRQGGHHQVWIPGHLRG